MKTYYLSSRKLSLYSVIGFFGLVVSSCGSYQNSSYYDHDGVYGSERPRGDYNNRYSEQNMAQANNYKEYFSDLQKDANNGVFTDVDNYSSQDQQGSIASVTNPDQYSGTTGYAGWGDNSSNVTVNVYNNDPWYWNRGYWNSWYSPYYGGGWNNGFYGSGWSIGFGWGWNSWYGPNYGWGWNNWYGPGWGWNSWYGPGWYNGYYSNRVYNSGPRGGSAYYNGRYNNSVYGYNNTGTRNYNSRRDVNFNRTYGTGTRDYNNYNNGTRNYNNGTRNYNNGATRDYNNNNNSGTRNYNYNNSNNNSGTRNYNYNNSNNSGTRSNSNYSAPTRSYNSGGSFGGSRGGGSFGGGGGGRSGGGGRR